ncbi:hypothetical protein [Nocardioides humi]|uniref:Uncharacterized protein n=1 Tax=Nocardioides humi TaxID=449461 RepID=A0ABN2AI58_9ACTN|nr:hypothetical protein [Nocardioides humi]
MSNGPIMYERYDDPSHRRSAQPQPAGADAVEKASTPGAVREAGIAPGKDASTPKASWSVQKKARGVEWVRPTDLIARQAGAVSRRGIDFQAELHRRARTAAIAAMRQVSERARRLPPVSAFGRRGGHQSGPVRSGVGMS